jgi:hypothetical protein
MCDSRRPDNGADSKAPPPPKPIKEPRWLTWTKAQQNAKELAR